jgi:L-alanine-DL-glutamate epimerase-like enolase superfamily enzyme
VSGRIRSVTTGTATIPLPGPLRLGPMEIREREYAALRVETDDGAVGKAYCLTRNAPVAACVDRLITPHLVGRDAADIEARWDDCYRANVFVGRTGLVIRALGLADVALWDIAAQTAGQPLWRHLGGDDPAVPVMMVAAYPVAGREPESLAADVVRYARDGYRLLKVARDADPDRMRRLLEAARAGLPEEARIVVDAGFGWRTAEEALAEFPLWGETPPLAWLEDPLVPEDAAGCAAIRRDGPHPVGVGDEVTDPGTYRALLDAGALDVLRLDVIAIGGVTAARRVQALAAERAVPVSFHIYPEVSVHLAATHPGTTVETFDQDFPGGNPLDPAHRLRTGPLQIADGHAIAPDAPGLGFDLDWSLFG